MLESDLVTIIALLGLNLVALLLLLILRAIPPNNRLAHKLVKFPAVVMLFKSTWRKFSAMAVLLASLNGSIVVILLPEGADPEQGILVLESPYDLQATINNIQQAIRGQNFRIIRQQFLPAGNKGMVIYFCNFGLLNSSLQQDMRVGMLAPFQLVVYEYAGKVRVMAVNPKKLAAILFDNQKLDDVVEQVDQAYRQIMTDATI